jgi:hypothetical protein
VFVQFLGSIETTGTDSNHIWQTSNLDRLDYCYSKLAHEDNFEIETHFGVQTAKEDTVQSCFQSNETDIPTCRSGNGSKYRLRSYTMRRCMVGSNVPDFSKDDPFYIFRVKQYKKKPITQNIWNRIVFRKKLNSVYNFFLPEY